MPEESTHVVYKGKHYVIPGKFGPEEAFVRVQNLTGTGPRMSPGPESEGFEDTSGEVAAILSKYHDPNAAREVLPRAAEGALYASSLMGAGGLAKAAVAGTRALKGMSAARKAATVAKEGGKILGVGIAADQAMDAVGVPPHWRAAILAAGGLSTKPGQAIWKALQAEKTAAGAPGAVAAVRTAASSTASPVLRFPAATSTSMPPAVVRGAAAPALAEAAPAVAAAESAAVPAAQGATAKAEEISQQILRWRNESKFSGAQIQSALRNVYGINPKDGRAMMDLVLKGASPLRAPRIEVGAQAVARASGGTKEAVRKATGPVLDEALGEASPILPTKALRSIIDTMKAMPIAEREAYVARATSGKAKWQVENIRRTLEHLGLLLPAAVAAKIAAEE